MSQYERRRRGNALSGDVERLPNAGNTQVGQRGSGHLAAFLGRMAAGLITPAHTQVAAQQARPWANQEWQGAYEPAFKPRQALGRSTEDRPRFETGPGKSGRPAF